MIDPRMLSLRLEVGTLIIFLKVKHESVLHKDGLELSNMQSMFFVYAC